LAARRVKRGKGRVGGARPGAGRRPLPAEERRGYPVMVRLSPPERELVEAAAGDESLATWIRDRALDAAKLKGRKR